MMSFVEMQAIKRRLANRVSEGYCPKCNGDLDEGFECTACGYDALPDLSATAGKPGEER